MILSILANKPLLVQQISWRTMNFDGDDADDDDDVLVFVRLVLKSLMVPFHVYHLIHQDRNHLHPYHHIQLLYHQI